MVEQYFQQPLKFEDIVQTFSFIRVKTRLVKNVKKFRLYIKAGRNDYLIVNTSANIVSRRFETMDFFNCSNINASGKVYAGEKCIVTEKVNETYMNIMLVNDCGLE